MGIAEKLNVFKRLSRLEEEEKRFEKNYEETLRLLGAILERLDERTRRLEELNTLIEKSLHPPPYVLDLEETRP